jgi:putative transposase
MLALSMRKNYWKKSKMRLTRNFKIPYRDDLKEFFEVSKNLYNQSLWTIKQHYKERGEYLNYNALDKIMKETKNLENEINYKLLPAQTSQQILKLLDKNFKSFFKSIKDYEKNPSKYLGKPKPPKYKSRYNLLIYTNQNSKIDLINRAIKLSKISQPIVIPKSVFTMDFKEYKQIRLLPKRDHIKIEIVYETEIRNEDLDYSLFASIDLGVNNLIAMITNTGNQPILINGKIIKSYNQFYNKIKSRLQSIKDKMNIKQNTKQLNDLETKRVDYINNQFHQLSRYIIRYLVQNKIGKLIIGKNKNQKQEVNIGKKNNQSFVQIPFDKLLLMLEYKAKLVGIEVVYQEESYTSKADALNLDPLPTYNKKSKKDSYSFSGKRLKRGLYQSSKKILLNADINSALNIARKVVGDSFLSLFDRGLWCNPVKIRVIEPNSLQRILCV